MDSQQPQKQRQTTAAKPDISLRCSCGSLLARVVDDGVELKCRRCKRQVIVSFATKGSVKIDM